MASQMSPDDFLNLTFSQVRVLLETGKVAKKKKQTEKDVMETVYEFRRKTISPTDPRFLAKFPNATDEDKRNFYGIWPFS